MSSVLWILLAALAALGLAAWGYGWREEPVPGRLVPAGLRAAGVFLFLAGLALPSLPRGDRGADGPLVLLDVSRSMALPTAPGGGARIDSARALLGEMSEARVLLFGGAPRPASQDSALAVPPEAGRTRAAPALEAAALSGAGSVLVLTDGEWDDRLEAERVAERVGLGVREVRVASPPARVGVGGLEAPDRLGPGDTARVVVEVTAGGPEDGLPDTVRVRVEAGGEVVGVTALAAPSPGRSARAEVLFVPGPPGRPEAQARFGGVPVPAGWRRYEAVVTPGSGPSETDDRRGFWLQVAEEPRGAVLVSTDPDWEPRFLLPVLERTVLGGARGYIRIAGERFVTLGPRPRRAAPGEVERAVRGARLLVVQAAFEELPPWLARGVDRHPRRLLLPRSAASPPAVPVDLSGPLAGEWYPVGAPAATPVAALLAGIPLEELPPLGALYGVEGLDAASGREGEGDPWAPIEVRRGRRGGSRPLALAGRRAGGRWALAAGEGTWRWALREGAPRRAYETLFGGLAGWLVEGFTPEPVELAEPPRAGAPLRWRVPPGVRELSIAVHDSAGAEVWRDARESPPETLEGPVPARGDALIVAQGRGPEGTFRWSRPVAVADEGREMLPRPPSEPLLRAASGPGAGEAADPGSRPVWPFVLGALLLCAEWAWRRRVGLR